MVYKSFKDIALFHRLSQKTIYVLIYSPKSMEHTKLNTNRGFSDAGISAQVDRRKQKILVPDLFFY